MLNAEDTQIYADFNQLSKLKNQAKKEAPGAIQEVAKQFESLFVSMMLKSMRQANLAEGILDNQQTEFYQDMHDQQLSLHLAKDGGIGLADIIAKQLSPNQPDLAMNEQRLGDYLRRVKMKTQSSASAIDSLRQSTDKVRFESVEEFVDQLRPLAKQAAANMGVDPDLLIAQAALETGWGKSIIADQNGVSSHNLFNIKADPSWHGQRITRETQEYQNGQVINQNAEFRAYDSFQHSFNDYIDFLQSNPRYQTALKTTDNPEQFINALQQAGYATDPSYADKVMRIYHGKALSQTQTL